MGQIKTKWLMFPNAIFERKIVHDVVNGSKENTFSIPANKRIVITGFSAGSQFYYNGCYTEFYYRKTGNNRTLLESIFTNGNSSKHDCYFEYTEGQIVIVRKCVESWARQLMTATIDYYIVGDL